MVPRPPTPPPPPPSPAPNCRETDPTHDRQKNSITGSGLQPMDGTGTNRLPSSPLSPSHPNYRHHPSNASISPNPAAFPLNTTRPWPASQNSHGPGSHE
eukprot:superscaffoldBa00001928_g12542